MVAHDDDERTRGGDFFKRSEPSFSPKEEQQTRINRLQPRTLRRKAQTMMMMMKTQKWYQKNGEEDVTEEEGVVAVLIFFCLPPRREGRGRP